MDPVPASFQTCCCHQIQNDLILSSDGTIPPFKHLICVFYFLLRIKFGFMIFVNHCILHETPNELMKGTFKCIICRECRVQETTFMWFAESAQAICGVLNSCCDFPGDTSVPDQSQPPASHDLCVAVAWEVPDTRSNAKGQFSDFYCPPRARIPL